MSKKIHKEKESPRELKSTRSHRISFMLNDEEYKAVERHLTKYKIANKSNWFRNTIIAHIFEVMEADYPTLFNENEMRR